MGIRILRVKLYEVLRIVKNNYIHFYIRSYSRSLTEDSLNKQLFTVLYIQQRTTMNMKITNIVQRISKHKVVEKFICITM